MTVTGAVYLDFEFREHPQDGLTLVVGCFWHLPTDERIVIDFRQADAFERLELLQRRWIDCIWFAYSARAEMTAFLHAGLSLDDMPWIDLMVEARQVTGTHYHYAARRAGLLVTLQALGILTDGDPAWKEAMRQLILSKTEYDDAEWDEIVRYCWSDIWPLPELWGDLLKIHGQRKFAMQPIAQFQTAQAIYRAEALKALSLLEYRSRGFPIDVPWLERIYTNHKAVRKAVAKECNDTYAGQVFRYNQKKDQYVFHHAGLQAHVDSLPFPVAWERTPTGKLKLDSDYLDEFVQKNPYFTPLQRTKRLLDQLKSGDLRQFLNDGYIRGSSLPFYTVTSRSQPLASEGFVFSLAHWLRSVVRPHEGQVLLGADYGQQEVFLAAALSGDRKLAAALATGDVYLALGQMAGAIPAGATKKTHPLERQAFKSVQLGIGYGMGTVRLGHTLYLDLLTKGADITLDDATERAVAILRWHKQTFTDYWAFVNREVSIAQQQGWMRARDGWTYFCNQNSKFTKLQNFHMQANGAVMLREAVKDLARIPEIELCCTLHDAIYLLALEDNVIIHQNHLVRCMRDAAKRVMAGAPLPLDIPIECHIYTHADGYVDPDGAEMTQHIRKILDDLKA